MDTPSLSEFLAEGIRSKVPHAELKQQALSVGWLEDEFNAAYAAALISSGVPVPDRGPKMTVRKSSTVEVIVSFFSIVLLCTVATALGVLLFQVVNRFFPDRAAQSWVRSGFSADAIHYSIATLIVGFPLYCVAMMLWLRGTLSEGEAKVESRLTKWLTYLVLLAASVTIVGDLIAVLFCLLRGEITARFLLKTLIIVAIGGAVLFFYFLERRKVQYRKDIPRSRFQVFGYAVSAFILASIVLGFLAAGSPATARKRQFDAQRADDLDNLAGCVRSYAGQYGRLPADLSDLKNSGAGYCSRMTDPETGSSYEYRVITASRTLGTDAVPEGEFELCATFALPSAPDLQRGRLGYMTGKWHDHKAGRNCNTETVALGR